MKKFLQLVTQQKQKGTGESRQTISVKKSLRSFFAGIVLFITALTFAGTALASVEIHIQGYNSGNNIAVGVSPGSNTGTALNVFGNPENTFPLYKNGNNNN